MGTVYEGNYLSDVVKGEADGRMSREQVVILAGSGSARSLVLGQVIGKRLFGAASVAADGGNTGNGAAGVVSLGSKAIVGDYSIECVEVSADGGRFKVLDPTGNRLDDLTVGTAYATDHINLTIADGAADFIVGDLFTVTVPAGDGKIIGLDLAGEDGTQLAYGLMISDAEAQDGADGAGVAISRDAGIVADKLTWPDGATEAQKTAGLAQLESRGIRAVATS